MTASPPKVNGHEKPPVLGEWQPVGAALAPEPQPAAVPETAAPREESDLVAQAQAEAIRAKAWAESEERRIAAEAEKEAALKRAEAEAEAIRVKAEEEARKLRLANDRAERQEAEKQAAAEARIAESNRQRDEAERARREAARQAAEQQQIEQRRAAEVAEAEDRWRGYARGFYIVCAIVALPVQVAAFYDPQALWLMAAPLMLEGGAWVVLKGAKAAAADHRPHWHYRVIAWCLAFIAAGINLWHGLNAFDPATATGTAFASIAGPGVYDLRQHGQLPKRDGALTRRERKAKEKAERTEAARKAAEEKRRTAEKEAAHKAAAEAAEKLAQARAKEFPKVWQHALRLAAALGEPAVTEAVWKRAYRDVEGTDPNESADIIRMRNAAEMRVEAARQKKPVSALSKTKNAQRAAQMPPGPNRVLKTRATRRPGDTPKYVSAARKQAAITAKNAAKDKGE